MTKENRVWELDGAKVRFRGAFDNRGAVLTGTWEQLGDANQCEPLMDIELRKVS